MISMRAEAKANKDYATSDKLRDALSGIGVQIKDTKEGVSWIYEK
jgi:cysteinyl-tRNA synthetase